MTDPPSPPRPAQRADLVGTLLADRYRFERLIATGGMAQVWEATDLELKRRVAVKLLHAHLADDHSFVERFRREAIAAARLAHPAIVSIYDTYSGDGMEAIVMELVNGNTLRQELDRHNGLPPTEVVRIGIQVADALAVAHQSRLVHRDIKPANILVCEDDRVMVADFGIAKLDEGGDHTQEGTMLGTAKYLAPEQVDGRPVDARTDVYALGVVLYEMLCGRPPFDAETDLATALARLHADPPTPRQVRADLPRELDRVVTRAIARDPDDRYAGAAELRAALLAADLGAGDPEGFVDHTAVTAVTPPSGTPAVAPVAPDAPAAAEAPPRPAGFVQSERSLLFPALVVVFVAAALAVAGVLIGNTLAERGVLGGDEGGEPGAPATTAPVAVNVTGASAFDPEGDRAENDNGLERAIDGDPESAWITETYTTKEFGGLKSGVGLVLSLDRAAELSDLTVASPSEGWSAEIYVAEEPAPELGGWGDPVVTADDIGAGETSFDLGGRRGGAVLVWITALPDIGNLAVADASVAG